MIQFEHAIQTLCDAGVEFVVIGGFCANLHGSARLTSDLDICFSKTSANLRRLTAALAPFHPRPRNMPKELPFIWDEATLRNAAVLTLETAIGEIDLLFEVAGVGEFDEVKHESVAVQAFDRLVYTLNLRSLIASKRAVGRGKDLEALHELETLLEVTEN